MDKTEKMAADIALAMDGGEWKDGKWYSKFHRDAWIKAVKPYADEIERLREENYELKDLLQCTVNYTGASVSSNRFTFHAALKEGE
jgi:hypothetical protein